MEGAAELSFVFIVGLISSFIGAIAGGASFISLPALIFIGVPPHLAVGSNRLGLLGFSLSSAFRFVRSDKIMWGISLPLCVLAAAAGTLGSRFVMGIDDKSLSRLLGILLLCLLPSTLLSPRVGLQREARPLWQRALGYVVASVLMFVAAVVGGGVGAAMFLTLVLSFGLTMLQANATYAFPVLILTGSSLWTFYFANAINFRAGFALFIGMTIGGYAGTCAALRKGDAWVRRIFLLMSLILSVKLVFDSFG